MEKSNCHEIDGCIAKTKRLVDVVTPIKLEVIASSEAMDIKCGRPRICDCSRCYSHCHKDGCEFTIKQTLCVEIPISYKVEAKTGPSKTNCN